jgi:hypothetical protein
MTKATWPSDMMMDYHQLGNKVADLEYWLHDRRKELKYSEKGAAFFKELDFLINDVKMELYKHGHEPSDVETEFTILNNENVGLKEKIKELETLWKNAAKLRDVLPSPLNPDNCTI